MSEEQAVERRLNRIEEVFKEIGITYSVYNRGLYYDLKDRKDLQLGVDEFNISNKTKSII